jgi:fatty-acid desaturase
LNYVLKIYLPGLILGGAAFWYSAITGLWPFVLVAWALISGLGIAVGYHRVYSHKTHNLKPWLDNIILYLGALGGQGSSISWTAVHRGYHHRFSDTEKDLHSPVAHGTLHAFIGWYWKITEQTINHKFAVDLLRRPNHVFVHKHYTKIIYAAAFLMALVSIHVLIVYAAALFISLLQDNLVNVLCHSRKIGYKTFDTGDSSNNFWLLGYFGWGQGWHNNHHFMPGAFNFGVKWWEFDPCVLWLPLLRIGSEPK